MRNHLFAIVILSILIGCKKDDSDKVCDFLEIAYITAIDAPETGTVGENIVIIVDFQVRNGCGNFSDFIEQRNDQTRTIEVKAKYEGCICTQATEPRTATYDFIAEEPGNYVLQFRSGPEAFIHTTINIR